MEEVWKKAVCARHQEFLEDIEVSTEGQIRRIRSKMLYKPHMHGGYLCIGKHAGKIKRWLPVHTLVAQTFIGPSEEGSVVDHKDGNKMNNRLSNLHYLSNMDNSLKGDRSWEGYKEKREEELLALKSKYERRLAWVCDALAKIGSLAPVASPPATCVQPPDGKSPQEV